MKKAMSETERRRLKQLAFNETHGITPKSVRKRIKDIIDGIYDPEEGKKELAKQIKAASAAPEDDKDLQKKIKLLEKQMFEAAKNFEFEKAAKLRDQLFDAKEKLLVNPV
jgi:excinuclease ABC subunit B